LFWNNYFLACGIEGGIDFTTILSSSGPIREECPRLKGVSERGGRDREVRLLEAWLLGEFAGV